MYVQDETLQKYPDHIKAFMGFIHRYKGIPLNELDLKAYRDQSLLLHFVSYLKERGNKARQRPKEVHPNYHTLLNTNSCTHLPRSLTGGPYLEAPCYRPPSQHVSRCYRGNEAG